MAVTRAHILNQGKDGRDKKEDLQTCHQIAATAMVQTGIKELEQVLIIPSFHRIDKEVVVKIL